MRFDLHLEGAIQSRLLWQLATEAADTAGRPTRWSPVASQPEDPPFAKRWQVTDYSGQALVSIIMAVATAEAFIHELPQLIVINRAVPWVEGLIEKRFLTLLDVLHQLEEKHAAVPLRYVEAGQTLGRPFDPAGNPLRDFQTLIAIRDDLVHPRVIDDAWETRKPKRFGAETYWPDYMTEMEARGLAQRHEIADQSWRLALKPAAVAAWGCDTVEKMVQAIAGEFPYNFYAGERSLREYWVDFAAKADTDAP